MPDRRDTTDEPAPPPPGNVAEQHPLADVDDDVVWDEVVEGGGATGRFVTAGTTVRITDTGGDGCCGLLAFNRLVPTERLNVADSVKVQWQAYLGLGSVLLSDMGRALLTIVGDTAGRHDAFCGTSTEATNRARYGGAGLHSAWPDGRGRFAVVLSKYGLSRRDIHPNLNLFKGVRIAEDGALVFHGAPTEPGRAVDLRAEMDLLLVVVAVPHVLDDRPRYTASPIGLTARRGLPTAPDDGRWAASPERARAYTNTAAFRLSVGQVAGAGR